MSSLSPLDAARTYTGRGWPFVPIPYKTKNPVIDGWPQLRLTEDELPTYFKGGPMNVGVLLGEPSGDLVDVDLDAPEAVQLADNFLPTTASCFGRAGKPRSHRLYMPSPLLPTTKFKDVDDKGTMLAEIRSTGAQTVFPPSVHPTGEQIAWENDGQPAAVMGDDLLNAVTYLAIAAILGRHWPSPPGGTRNEIALAAAGELLRAGLGVDVARRIIRGAARAADDEEWADREKVVDSSAEKLRAGEPTTGRPTLANLLIGDGDKVVRRIRTWLGQLRSREESGPDSRPLLIVSGDLVDMTAKAWAALEAANMPPTLFRRGATPVRLERDDDGTPMTRPLIPDRMRYALARAARFQVLRRRQLVEVAPPMSVVQDLLATPEPPLPVLDRIVEVPTFSASGRLRLEPGYDPEGRTYVEPAPGLTVPEVSERPSAAELATAKALIREDLLGDFPFVASADVAHVIALGLLPFGRELITGPTPLHDLEAPAPGTGKSLLVDVALSPALGRPIPAMAEGRDDDEWRKRISAKLFASSSVIFLDNLRRRLDSSAVAAAITSRRWEDRVLGRSEIHAVPVRCVWVSTGNNPIFSLEMARRSIRIRLDSGLEQPWLRKEFRHEDIRRWALENRGRLIWAHLTLIQAWIAAGRPWGTKRLGMFESWAGVIGGVLQIAGIEGFLANLDEFYAEADEESGELRALAAAWWEKHRDKLLTAAELISSLSTEALPDTVAEAEEKKRSLRLARYLAGKRDRRIKIGGSGPTVFIQSSKRGGQNKVASWQLRLEGN